MWQTTSEQTFRNSWLATELLCYPSWFLDGFWTTLLGHCITELRWLSQVTTGTECTACMRCFLSTWWVPIYMGSSAFTCVCAYAWHGMRCMPSSRLGRLNVRVRVARAQSIWIFWIHVHPQHCMPSRTVTARRFLYNIVPARNFEVRLTWLGACGILRLE